MGTNSPQKTHFVPFSGLKSDFPAPGSFQKDDILLSDFCMKLIKSVPWPDFHFVKSRYLPGQILIAAALFGLVPKVFFKLL